jgi:hypothetical protein
MLQIEHAIGSIKCFFHLKVPGEEACLLAGPRGSAPLMGSS